MFGIIVGVVGFIALIAIGYVISKIDKSHANAVSIALPTALLFLVVCIGLESYTIVKPGHAGVQVTLGQVNPVALKEGFNIVNPISSVRDVEVRVKRADLKEAQAGTKDLQSVHTDIVINYRLSGDKVAHIYKEFGLNVDDKILGPGVNEAFKAVTAKYNSEELITKRDMVSAEILEHVKAKVAPFDIEVSNISLVNFGFSQAYQAAIEAKVIATQQKQKAEQDLERVKVEAQSRIAQAEGEAKAIAIQATAIQNQGGAAYVNLKAIEKWDGKLPNVNSGAVPFINLSK